MPRHEPSQRAEPGEVLSAGKVVMRRTKDGKLVFVPPEPKRAEEPEQPTDTAFFAAPPPTNAPKVVWGKSA